jgi:hypothetical protein
MPIAAMARPSATRAAAFRGFVTVDVIYATVTEARGEVLTE